MELLIIASVSSMVLQNGLFNFVAKNELNKKTSVSSFNLLMYITCAVVFGALTLFGTISVYTVLIGLVYGVLAFLTYNYRLTALKNGPMHLTMLFTTSSMIIPTLSGVFFGEEFSIYKLLVVFVLLFFLYLSFAQDKNSKIGKKWFFCCLIAFLCQGILGILQKIHQASEYKSETSAFLLAAFVCAIVLSLITNKGKFDSVIKKSKVILIAVACGVCGFAMNYINLILAGVLPSQLFFPVVNGSSIVLTSISSVVLFKEHLTKKQAIGLIGGIISLIVICLVP